MGWEKGLYYTRSRKIYGRVVREYVGGGEAGKLAAEIDAQERQRREEKRQRWRAERDEIETLDEAVATICQSADAVAAAAMVAAGFHYHRGEWRRRRAQDGEI